MPNFNQESQHKKTAGPIQENPPFEEPETSELQEKEKEIFEEPEKQKEPEIETKKEEITFAPLPVNEEELNVLKEADKLREIKVESKKIEHLLGLAQTKGLNFAVDVAKKTQDACLLDLFHDKLVEKGMQEK